MSAESLRLFMNRVVEVEFTIIADVQATFIKGEDQDTFTNGNWLPADPDELHINYIEIAGHKIPWSKIKSQIPNHEIEHIEEQILDEFIHE
jgi:hypothetical protein